MMCAGRYLDMMQAGKDYGVRVMRPFLQFQPGFVIFPPAMYREKLLHGKWVEEVTPPTEEQKKVIRQKTLGPTR